MRMTYGEIIDLIDALIYEEDVTDDGELCEVIHRGVTEYVQARAERIYEIAELWGEIAEEVPVHWGDVDADERRSRELAHDDDVSPWELRGEPTTLDEALLEAVINAILHYRDMWLSTDSEGMEVVKRSDD